MKHVDAKARAMRSSAAGLCQQVTSVAPDIIASVAGESNHVADAPILEHSSSVAEIGDLQRALNELWARFPAAQFVLHPDCKSLRSPGGWELYSGNFAVAKQMIAAGAPWVLTFDIKRTASEDLLDNNLQKELLSFAERGVFQTFGLAPICASFSRAITPYVRSRRWPRGLPTLRGPMLLKVQNGNKHASFCLQLIKLAIHRGWAYFCENPDTSFLWLQNGWQAFVKPSSRSVFRLSYCRFGTRWRKDTRVATNTCLAGLRMLCKCGSRPRQRLRGYSLLHGRSWTAVSEPYPRGVSKILAIALCVHAGWCKPSRLNIAGCSRSASLRIGEALNLGPRRLVTPRPSLSELPTLSAATMALEARILQTFVDWCKTEVRCVPLDQLFDASPEVLVYLLRVCGDLMFQQRRALSSFRHLLLAVQRWRPMVRPLMQPAWELIGRWELQEPVQQRIPIPEPLVRAMIVLAWCYKWHSWCGATIIAFYGGGRLGEILQCIRVIREDLLWPTDVLENGPGPVFLK